MRDNIIISEDLPVEKIVGLRFLYIVIDSDMNIHYEFNNKGHIVLPIHRNEILPWMILKYLPINLINKCASAKKNIVGVVQLWIYYTKDYCYALLRARGILENFRGNKSNASALLDKAMDEFCLHHGVKFIETSTRVLPELYMRKRGFIPEPNRKIIQKVVEAVFRQTHYVKKYS